MLVVENITKKFAGVTALNDVTLSLEQGKVTAILGENGAGKSTLMKILSGVYQDFEGSIKLNGQSISFSNPRDAQEKGIVIIHQELNLLPWLSISDNIFLGRELLNKAGFLDKKAMRARTAELLNQLKLRVDPATLVADLKVGQQQVVEIAKALLINASVVIMDEPTSAISEHEVNILFDIIRELRSQGKTVVYISHKLDELFRIADNYVVLRDGRTIEQGIMQAMSHEVLIKKMVGREVKLVNRQQQLTAASKPVLEVRNLELPKRLSSTSFHVHAGEILGIFGLMGAGRTEMLESIFGLHKSSRGQISINGQEVKISSPKEAIRAGLALVPEDRKKDGLMLELNVRKNISITTLDKIQQNGFLNTSKEASLASQFIQKLQIKTASDQLEARMLSGGNQQKIVIAKWLATKPKVLLLDEPTRGIDIHAKNEIYKLIQELASEGMAIVMVSSELPEILALSNRVMILSEGNHTATIPIAEASEDNILAAAIPKTI